MVKTNPEKTAEQINEETVLLLQKYEKNIGDVTESAIQEAKAGNWPKALKMLWAVSTLLLQPEYDLQTAENTVTEKVCYDQAQRN